MRSLCKIFLSLTLAALGAHAAFAQTTITAATGSISIGSAPIATGTVVFVPVDASGRGIAVTKASGGLALAPVTQPNGTPIGYSCAIVNGGITGSCSVPDSSTATPVGFAYNLTFLDTSTGNPTSGQSATLTQVHNVQGSTWALDHYVPSTTVLAAGAYTVTEGVGAPSGTFGVNSFYLDITAPTAPVMYAAVNGTMQKVTGTGGNGSQGPQGVAGLSAYQVAVANGFSGSQAAWLASLVGATGPQGPQGPAGTNGSSSPATSAAPGTVTLAAGQTSNALSTVATTGSYTDLVNKPTLGSAAAQPTTAFDASGVAAGLVINNQVASTGGVTAGLLVYPDPANLPAFTVTPINSCGNGPAGSTAAAGATFRVLDPIQTYSVLADGPVVAGDLLVGSPTVAGEVHDSGQTASVGISQQSFICGKALTAVASAGNTVTVDPVGRGLRGGKIDTLAVAQSAISTSLTPPASGLAALYNFTNGSLADISGNNAAAIVNGVSGANLATYVPGVGFGCNDSGITYNAQCVMVTPFQTFRGFMATYCQPAASLTSGSTSNTLAPQFPTLLAANNTGVGLRIANSPYYSGAPNSYYSGNAVQPLMFNSATNGGITGANEVFGNCVHLAYSVGVTTDAAPNNVDRIWVNGVERTPYRLQGASGSIVTLTGSNFYELMDFAGLSTFGMRGAIVDAAFKATALGQTDVSTHMLWQESLKNTSPLLAARFNPPTVPGIVPNLYLDCDSIFAGLFQTTAWYTQLTLNKTYNVVPAGMAGELGISCAANFDTKAAPYLRVPGSVYVHLAGANDASVGRSVADLAQSDFLLGAKLNAIGARGVLATMLASTNTTPTAGQFAGGTFDAYKVAINTQRRNNMGNWIGWNKIADLAAAPALGGNGNASNTSCFNGGLHPISTGSVVTIGSTTYSCSQAMAVIVSGAINDMDGYTVANPRLVAATAYSFLSGDGAISQTPTASITDTADDCLQASTRAIINNAAVGSGFNITFGTVNSETVSGNAVVAPGTTGIFRSMVTGGSASTTGGCYWQRIQ